MVTHLNIILNVDCLTSVKWPFTLAALTSGSCLYCANVSYFKDGWAVNLNASIKAQHKHETTMRAVRVNGKITEVKQSTLRLILRWVTIWNPNILSFLVWLWLALLISLSFGKNSIGLSCIKHCEALLEIFCLTNSEQL